MYFDELVIMNDFIKRCSTLDFIKVISYKKSISLILIALIITLITSISTNYKVLSKTFDNFMTILFSNIINKYDSFYS